MCFSLENGTAAAVLCSADKAKQFTTKPVHVRAPCVGPGSDHAPGEPGITERISQQAYKQAGLGPEELSVIELHDASAPAELVLYEELGLCGPGEGGKLIDARATYFDGPVPVNTSGGLISKGHPIGAAGGAQVYEVFVQLRREAGGGGGRGGLRAFPVWAGPRPARKLERQPRLRPPALRPPEGRA